MRSTAVPRSSHTWPGTDCRPGLGKFLPPRDSLVHSPSPTDWSAATTDVARSRPRLYPVSMNSIRQGSGMKPLGAERNGASGRGMAAVFAPQLASGSASPAASADAALVAAGPAPEVAAAVLPRPDDPVYETDEKYPSVRTLQPTTRLAWPARMDYTGYGEMLSLLAGEHQAKPEVRRVWVEGRAAPWPPPHSSGACLPAPPLASEPADFCRALHTCQRPGATLSRVLRRSSPLSRGLADCV